MTNLLNRKVAVISQDFLYFFMSLKKEQETLKQKPLATLNQEKANAS